LFCYYHFTTLQWQVFISKGEIYEEHKKDASALRTGSVPDGFRIFHHRPCCG
jgi:hypothetical protein